MRLESLEQRSLLSVSAPGSFTVPPNDPLFPHEWNLHNIGGSNGVKGADANVEPAWLQGDTGQGEVIGIVDTGVYAAHPDLAPNYDAALSYNFLESNPNATPPAPIGTTGNDEGTEVAGVAAAAGNNGIGLAGVAPNASIAGIRLIGGTVAPQTFANAMEFDDQQIDIYNNSWRPGGALPVNVDNSGVLALQDPQYMAAIQAIKDAATNGRGGLGSVYVFAAGDGNQFQSDVNYNDYANSRFVIAVAGVDDAGKQALYSDPGAALLVSAPTGSDVQGGGSERGVPTTDVIDNNNTTPSTLKASYLTDGSNGFTGTEAAAPVVSGVVALMLAANPNLSYRDVQMILAESATKNDPTDPGWTTNHASFTTDGVNFTPYHINNKYGFGEVNAAAAVNLARSWTPLLPQQQVSTGTINVNQPVLPGVAGGESSAVTLSGVNLHVERADLTLTTTGAARGDLTVTLTSPSGTQSVLAATRTTDVAGDYTNWVFDTTRDWGENASGTWTVQVSDPVVGGATNTFVSWSLNVYGTPHYAPVAQDTTVTTKENQLLGLNLLADTFDSETGTSFGGMVVPSSLAVTQPAHGTAVIDPNTGLVTYTPAANFFGTDSFTYTVLDNFGDISRSAVVTVNVQKVDQPPLVVNVVAIVVPGHSVQIPVLANAVPGNSAINPSTVTIVSPPSFGTVSVNTAGVVTYTPGAGFVSSDSFTYDVQDVNGGVSNVATVTVLRNFPAPTAVN
ncbi:MAG TPA: S8 family serine peptidase, partial [Pirellulales bacterium]|nr:S8 family serine peptidase [Pirellulales bacterium]